MACSDFIQPLDLECLLVNTFSETFFIFAAISLIVISALGARFRMPNTIFLSMLALFVVLFSRYMQGFYLVVLVIGGLIVSYAISKMVKN